MTYLNNVDSNRQIILTKDLISQTIHDPSAEADTALYKIYNT